MNSINYDDLPHNNILCVDMKSFFASVEAVAREMDPLKVFLAVVGDKNRESSVVLAASPLLKEKYNIKTGNRFYEIPEYSEIKIVNARMGLYLETSLQITRLFNNFVPLDALHVYSIDESWLKLDGTERLLGDKYQVAKKIRNELLKKFGLHCSMGLGPNMFLAKVAMDIEGKKKGFAEWTYDDVPHKLWPLALDECWGIGSRLKKRFNRLGIKTVGELAQLSLTYLEKRFGIMGSQLYYHARGIDLSKVEGHYREQPKNLGRGITLLHDYKNEEEIRTVIFDLSEEVAKRSREKGLVGKTISLGIGYSREELNGGFYVQRSLKQYTNLTHDVYGTCLDLFSENYRGEVVRKINVALGNFSSHTAGQLNLFINKTKENKICKTKDEIEDKFGYRALFYGRSLKKGSVRKKIKTTTGGHKTF